VLFFFLFSLEDVEDHHDEENRDGYAEQDAQQYLTDKVEAERLEEEECKMMDKHHA
jgi:hypothetical protein